MRLCNFDNEELTCKVCGQFARSREAKANCLNSEDNPGTFAFEYFATSNATAARNMPGEILHSIIESIGIVPKEDCNCGSLRSRMNALGVNGCRRERDLLIAELKENAKQYGAFDKLKATKRVMELGIAKELLSFDPIAALFDYALKQAESSLSERNAWQERPQ